MMNPSAPSLRSILCLGLLLVGLTHEASAQAMYRIVGPDGKVTYSDRPPQDTKSSIAPAKAGKPAEGIVNAGPSNNPPLPFALQQVVTKYPATLYTAQDCEPCALGRALLTQRGVPFTEKTIITRDDQVAYKKISNTETIPLLVLGGQQIKGYSESEWHSYLDAASYPKQSALPRGYQQAPAQPLVPLKTAAEAPATPTASDAVPLPRPAPAPVPRPNPANNPAGIKF